MNYAVTYGCQRFDFVRKAAHASLAQFVDKAYLFTDKELEPYRKDYPKILYDGARGGGFWLYKALFLNKILSEINDGDGLIWMDAGAVMELSPSVLFKIAAEHDGLCFSKQNHKNKYWTKRDCFVLMDCDSEKYYEDYQVDASFLCFTKTEKTTTFLKNWLDLCGDYRKITDQSNECGENLPEFKDHRHDQSILSLMASQENFPRFRSPTQYGLSESREIFTDYEWGISERYGPIINHHRQRY